MPVWLFYFVITFVVAQYYADFEKKVEKISREGAFGLAFAPPWNSSSSCPATACHFSHSQWTPLKRPKLLEKDQSRDGAQTRSMACEWSKALLPNVVVVTSIGRCARTAPTSISPTAGLNRRIMHRLGGTIHRGMATTMDGVLAVQSLQDKERKVQGSDRIDPNPGQSIRVIPKKRSITREKAKPKAKKALLLCRHLRSGWLRLKCLPPLQRKPQIFRMQDL